VAEALFIDAIVGACLPDCTHQENDPNFSPSVHGNASQLAEAAAVTALAAEAAAKGLPAPPFTVTDSVFEEAVSTRHQMIPWLITLAILNLIE